MSAVTAVLLLAVLVVASVTDLRSRIVPNGLTLAAAVAGLALAASGGPEELLSALAAGVMVSSPLLLVALLRPEGLGMGDVKLVAVIGIFLGWHAWPALLGGLLLAALAGLAASLWSGRPPSAISLPLVPFLAAGTVPVLDFAL
jgi:leader peptidase (prepilin peptidase)/N-methyltransferase